MGGILKNLKIKCSLYLSIKSSVYFDISFLHIFVFQSVYFFDLKSFDSFKFIDFIFLFFYKYFENKRFYSFVFKRKDWLNHLFEIIEIFLHRFSNIFEIFLFFFCDFSFFISFVVTRHLIQYRSFLFLFCFISFVFWYFFIIVCVNLIRNLQSN